jgi:hypothetical protein
MKSKSFNPAYRQAGTKNTKEFTKDTKKSIEELWHRLQIGAICKSAPSIIKKAGSNKPALFTS